MVEVFLIGFIAITMSLGLSVLVVPIPSHR